MNDEEFLRRFEDFSLPLEQFHHRDHIRLAYLYLCRHSFETALDNIRHSLKAYNAAHNVPETLDRGYHDTITVGWARLVHCALCEFGKSGSADEFIDSHTQLLTKHALLFFYSRDLIKSAEAKERFIKPDLAALPRSRKVFIPTTE